MTMEPRRGEINFIMGFEESHAAFFNYLASSGNAQDVPETIGATSLVVNWMTLQTPFDIASMVAAFTKELLSKRVDPNLLMVDRIQPECLLMLIDHPTVCREIYGCTVNGHYRRPAEALEIDRLFKVVTDCLSQFIIDAIAENEGLSSQALPLVTDALSSMWDRYTLVGEPSPETLALSMMCVILEGTIEVAAAIHHEMVNQNLPYTRTAINAIDIGLRGNRDLSVYYFSVGYSI